jgi:antitoxin HicB
MVTHEFAYPVLIERTEAGDFVARIADMPEVLTGGDSEAEALAEVQDALEEAVLARLANGQDIPAPGSRAGAQAVALLPPIAAGRVLIDTKRRQEGWTKVELARRIGKDEKVARRILDGRGGVSMTTVLEALGALGFATTLAWR